MGKNKNLKNVTEYVFRIVRLSQNNDPCQNQQFFHMKHRNMLALFAKICLLSAFAILQQSEGFSISGSNRPLVHSSIKSSALYDSPTPSCMEGVSQFEQWWTKVSSSPSPLEHSSFENGQLRGLQFIGGNKYLLGSNKNVASIPRNFVLRTPLQTKEGEMTWDTNLAIQLLDEYAKGSSSELQG